MDLKKEIITALQLFALLCLVYWSCTWNLPSDYDAFEERAPRRECPKGEKPVVDLYPKGFPQTWNKHSIVLETFKSVKSASYKALQISSSSETLLPPFYAWKEVELTKQENGNLLGKGKAKPSSSKRKLNYASSKCGAKILSSNPEVSYRTAILNEKIDDYMLNPCRANAWFVVELCDTIEATQIELANYELYSSSPRTFSTFWSDVYPTQRWHHLGTFEAKDQRSMQTFNLTTRNLGKFIKVTVSSHYGKEHFCPLSVIRVLGYSMVYEYDDSDDKNQMETGNERDHAIVNRRSPASMKSSTVSTKSHPAGKCPNTCQNYLKCYNHTLVTKFNKNLLGQSSCIFLSAITAKTKLTNKDDLVRNSLPSERCSAQKIKHKATYQSTTRQQCIKKMNMSQNIHDFRYFISHYQNLSQSNIGGMCTKLAPMSDNTKEKVKVDRSLKAVDSGDKREAEGVVLHQRKNLQDHALSQMKHIQNREETVSSQEGTDNDEGVTESAALIQKESVITKLTNRIKASETSLSLINRYLQQLSESYRQQMEDMQIMFNGTIKAIGLASEKAAAIDEQQQTEIERLERKMNALYHRVEYFVDGHEHLLKRVLELHGFFLVLEFIIMSTIFSLFVNNFKQNKFSVRNRRVVAME